MFEIDDNDRLAASFDEPDDRALGHVMVRDAAKAMLFGQVANPRIGRFEVIRRLGQGGMGEVFLARDAQLERPVALKVLRARLVGPSGPQTDEHASALERSRREALALARVSHPNVIEVFEVGEHEGRPFVAMEYVEGWTLDDWIAEHEPGWAAIVEVFVAAGRGLLAAHRAGLIHRDFKPDNLLVSGTGDERRVRVLDFGLARISGFDERALESLDDSTDPRLTHAGAILGTPAFMAPEQLRGEVADEASDQFSFCLALYRALWGEEPFGGTSVEARRQILEHEDPATPPAGAAPRSLWPVIRRGLARERGDRWPDMAALLAALEAAASRRRVVGWAWVGVALVAAGIGLGVAFVSGDDPSTPAGDACAFVHERAAEVELGPLVSLASSSSSSSSRAAPWAEHALGQLDAELGRWSAAWLERRLALCEAGEEGSMRAACLDRAQGRAVRLVADWREADARALEVAVESFGDLPSLAACNDEEALELGLAPVPDAQAEHLEQHRDALAEVRRLRRGGRRVEAERALAELEREAETFAYEPFAAELAVERAKLELDASDEALGRLEAAAKLAQRVRHDRLATSTWTVLAYWAADRETPHPRAEDWLEQAEIGAARLGSPGNIKARLSCIRGALLAHDPSSDARAEARAAFEDGLRQLDALDDQPRVWLGIGDDMSRGWRPVCLSGLAGLESGEAALELAARALASAEQLYGEGHPETADYAFGLARRLLESDDPAAHERAAALLGRIGERWLASGAASVQQVATASMHLAIAKLEAGELDLAQGHIETALQGFARTLGASDPAHANVELVAGTIADRRGG